MKDTWVNPFEYTIRESQRAKRVILKVSEQNGLEVVVPRGFSRRRLPEILKEKESWIETQLQQIKEVPAPTAPEYIDLRAMDQRWQVCYRGRSDGRFVLREAAPNVLLVERDAGDVQGIASVLDRWLHLKAQACLVPWLRKVSREFDIPFNKATVRGQTTRWASCSKLGNISLNRSLLLLPERLVRHVFLHELCHIKQLDHSPKFWSLFGEIESNYKSLEAEVKNADNYVPPWVRLT